MQLLKNGMDYVMYNFRASNKSTLNFFQKLLFVYILLSLINEVIWLSNIQSFLLTLKTTTLLCMLFYSLLNFTKITFSVEKRFYYVFIFFVAIQIWNLFLSLRNYEALENIYTSISYIIFIWLFFFYYQLYPYEKKINALKKLYILLIVFLLISVGVSFISPDSLYTAINERIRFNFGYINTNRLASLLFITINLGWIISKENNSKNFKLFLNLSLIFPLLLLILTDSRTPLLLLVLEIILILLVKIKILNFKFIYYLVFMWMFLIITFIFQVKYKDYVWLDNINSLTSGRIYIWQNVLSNLKETELLLGVSSENTYVNILRYYSSIFRDNISIDNFYISIVFNFGVISLALFIIFLLLLVFLINNFTMSSHKIKVLILYLTILIYAFMEGFLISVNNITSIIFWICLASTFNSEKIISRGGK